MLLDIFLLSDWKALDRDEVYDALKRMDVIEVGRAYGKFVPLLKEDYIEMNTGVVGARDHGLGVLAINIIDELFEHFEGEDISAEEMLSLDIDQQYNDVRIGAGMYRVVFELSAAATKLLKELGMLNEVG